MRILNAADLQALSIPEEEFLFNYCASRGGSRDASKKALYVAVSGVLVIAYYYYFSAPQLLNESIISWIAEVQSILITATTFLLPALVLAYLWLARIRSREEKYLQLMLTEAGLDIYQLTK